jgi:N-acetyl-anhydromuramyl-L-alanine amidase AmpD
MNLVNFKLAEENYFKEKYPKTQIYLHHTVSSTASSPLNWWNQDGRPIATAFVVDKEGTVYKAFPSEYWSYHLGLRYGPGKGFADKKSIGIELVNEGPLQKISEGKFKWYDGKANYRGKVSKLIEPWRGYEYFASYPEEQVNATLELVRALCDKYTIPKQMTNHFEYDETLAETFSGILFHCNVRQDKTDISKAFPSSFFQYLLTTEGAIGEINERGFDNNVE